jgi:uncharacterized protein (TIGR02271 family)
MTYFPSDSEIVVPLHVEDVSGERRKVERDVRINVRTVSHDHLIDEALAHDRVDIERVAIARPIDVIPPFVREEGDTTVISIVEEVLVIERRLVLKEEIHLRRVRTTERHRQIVTLREQQAVIERTVPGERTDGPPAELAPIPKPPAQGTRPMTDETIVAVYDTSEHASRAVRDLESAGVPSSAIKQHTGSGLTTGSTTTAAPGREKGFWASLFGGEPEHEYDTTVYDRSLDAGSTVVTVKAGDQHLTQVIDILERHNPIDIDERATSYGLATGSTTTTRTTATAMPSVASGRDTSLHQGGEEVVPLAEEQLTVGKRLVNRGSTRIRRFVVETPVEEAVTLHSERVSVERRPVASDTKVADADFTDRTIEVTETDEEAVVGKAARVKEEVVVNKAATERVETVRDTVRREDVEITRDDQATESSDTTTPVPPNPHAGV